MFEKLALGAMALFMACKVFAVQLSPQEALARMNNTQSQAKGIVTDNTPMQLAYTSSFNGNNTYYVFNKDNNEGYVILSADDCMPAVLGMVNRGSFDIDKVPENMKWWLSQYDISISDYASKGKKYVSSATKQNIEPLLGNIAYNQHEPYNDLCPLCDGRKAVTDCVATAMAQIMRMHKWPERGTGVNEYKCYIRIGSGDDISREAITLKTDFSQSIYQWDKMPETYNGNESPEEKQAVARLMYDCGVSVNMGYDPYGSSAPTINAFEAFIKYFNYDRNATLINRQYYEDAEWEDLMYENLNKGLPIFYVGLEKGAYGECHAFVCDGYQAKDNLFHFNWGWDGRDNGYFLMATNANDAKSSLYPHEQVAILNLKPASEPFDENKEVEFPWTVSYPYEFRTSNYSTGWKMTKVDRISRSEFKETAKRGNPIALVGRPFITRYNGFSNREYAIGIKAQSEKYEFVETIHNGEVTPETIFDAIKLTSFNIPKNGKYTISFVYKDLTAGDTEWKEMNYLPGIEKPVIEFWGIEEGLYIADKPELIYEGKVITNEVLPVKPNMNDYTIRVKFWDSMGSDERKIDCKTFLYGQVLSETKTVTIPAISKGSTQAVDFTISPEILKYGMQFDVSFYESGEMIPYLTGDEFSFYVGEAQTGIDTITQNEEKKATEVIYDLYGRKVKNMNKGGIYITGGKKVIAK